MVTDAVAMAKHNGQEISKLEGAARVIMEPGKPSFSSVGQQWTGLDRSCGLDR